MEYILGLNCKLQVAKTLEAAKTIGDISVASEGVVTTTAAHGYSTGDYVALDVPSGMYLLDGQLSRIVVLSATTFKLERQDTSDFTAYYGSDATVQRITAWEDFDNATKWTLAEGSTDRPDLSTIHRRRKTTVLGMEGELSGSIDLISNPDQAAVKLVRAAARAQARMAQRLITGDGRIIGCNSEWAGGRGMDVDKGAVSMSAIQFTCIGEPIYYPS